MKSRGRRTFFNPLALQRRGTNRMSRRTMRLSRASVWMMRRDVKAFVIFMCLLLSLLCFGASYKWYQKRQATWLGIDLDELGRTKNETDARAVLRVAISDACRRDVPAQHDPIKPLLFQGGALSPVNLACIEEMERVMEKKMIRVTGIDPSKVVVNEVGFLGMKHFAKPPPQRKKNRWKRKKAWKFFRQDVKSPAVAGTGAESVSLANESSEIDEMESHVEQTMEDAVEEEVPTLPDVDANPSPAVSKEAGWRQLRAWRFFGDYPQFPRANTHVEPFSKGVLGFLEGAVSKTEAAAAKKEEL